MENQSCMSPWKIVAWNEKKMHAWFLKGGKTKTLHSLYIHIPTSLPPSNTIAPYSGIFPFPWSRGQNLVCDYPKIPISVLIHDFPWFSAAKNGNIPAYCRKENIDGSTQKFLVPWISRRANGTSWCSQLRSAQGVLLLQNVREAIACLPFPPLCVPVTWTDFRFQR